MNDNWLAIDLDGTLAEYHGWKGIDHIGAPIPAMVEQLISYHNAGWKIAIFTARVSDDDNLIAKKYIQLWLATHGLASYINLITATKYKFFSEFWDDRARQVIENTGRIVVDNKNPLTIEEIDALLAAPGQKEVSDFIPVTNEVACATSMDMQVDGNHYNRMLIQPAEYALLNGLGACEAMIIKYISRHRNKNGKKDLEKAKHFIDMLIEHEYEGTFHNSLMKRMERYDVNSKKD